MDKKQNDNKTIGAFEPIGWYRLDNAGKVYPPSITDVYSEMFRLSAVLKEPVDAEVLQKALADIFPRFPTMMITLKKGFFWYYFEKLTAVPKVQKEEYRPLVPFAIDGKSPFVRVMYDRNRVSCDFFHGVADGYGALAFVSTLLTRYFEIKTGKKVADLKCALNYTDEPTEAEAEDSFHVYAEDHNFAKRKIEWAYIPKLAKSKEGSYVLYTTSAGKLYKAAKSYNTTITIYLMAVLAEIMMKMREEEGSNKPFHGQIPVNLRKYYKSKTLRNFSDYLDVAVRDKLDTRAEYVTAIKNEVEKQMTLEHFQSSMNTNHREEASKLLGCFPRVFKDIAIVVAKKLFGDNGFSMCISNLGKVELPSELDDMVDRMELSTKEPQAKGYKMTLVTFKDQCTIALTGSFSDRELEKRFATALADDGLELYVEANGGAR